MKKYTLGKYNNYNNISQSKQRGNFELQLPEHRYSLPRSILTTTSYPVCYP